MQTFKIYQNLKWLNDLPADEAVSVFLDCCGSQAWAGRMANSRPFPMLDDLFRSAEDSWQSLSPADHLEAFAAHPKIGAKPASSKKSSKFNEWSKGEQSEVGSADNAIKRELADANSLYQERFGFIFIICATGKSASEMLEICRVRMNNSAETEMRVAADEQRKITELRLTKLLEK